MFDFILKIAAAAYALLMLILGIRSAFKVFWGAQSRTDGRN